MLNTFAVWLLGLPLGQTSPPDNLDFRQGLRGWEGQGFALVSGTGAAAVDSGTCERIHGSKALLHRAILVPPGAGILRCTAYATGPAGGKKADPLDVVVLAAGKRIVPKQVRQGSAWRPVDGLLPADSGRGREYRWEIDAWAGQYLRIVLLDEDSRLGAAICCSGFELVSRLAQDSAEFASSMASLAARHALPPLVRSESDHFLVMSNTDDAFTEMRLRDGELIYRLFLDHFRRRGFRLHEPAGKLMAAFFDSQAGFEAYLGHKTSPLITGIYHPATNRLVTYDFGQNEKFRSRKEEAERLGRRIDAGFERQRFQASVLRRAEDVRTRANIGTIMHEVAHQLSFNTGLLHRDRDVPLWLAEGLACYCEPTSNNAWQGIGEMNAERLATLKAGQKGQAKFWSLRQLVENDHWLRQQEGEASLMGYAQSWALVHMLVQEDAPRLRNYLRIIQDRTISDRRIADFQAAFGSDWPRLEARHAAYVQKLLRSWSAGP